MVWESFGRKHHGRKMTASNHQGMAKHYDYYDSEYFWKGKLKLLRKEVPYFKESLELWEEIQDKNKKKKKE